MTPRVLCLTEISNEHASLVGAKALTLAELRRRHFPVPDGFVVTTEAFRRAVLPSYEFQSLLSAYLETPTSVEETSRLAEQIQRSILAVELSSELKADILAASDRFGDRSFVVRSSATVEDLPNAAFAGQYESYLDIARDGLFLAIKRCWASLWSARAAFYRLQRGIETTDVYMAVLVQEMIRGHSSGVAFTANPVTGRRDQIVVNMAKGSGEAVVGGTVTPDAFVFGKDQHHPNRLVSEIGSLALQVEATLGAPQDIEWVYGDGGLHLVQSRPITGLADQDKPPHGAGVLKTRLLELLLEYFPRPLYPLDRSVVLPLIQETFDVSKVFGLRPAASGDVLALDPDGTVRLEPLLPRVGWGTPIWMLRGVANAVSGLGLDPSAWSAREWPVFQLEMRARLANASIVGNAEATVGELSGAVSLPRRMFAARQPYFLGAWLAMGLLPILLRLVFRNDARRIGFALLANLNHPTARMNSELRGLAALAAESRATLDVLAEREPDLAKASPQFAEAFRRFMTDFGCRTDVLVPLPSSVPWYENQSHVLKLVLRLTDGATSSVGEQTTFLNATARIQDLGWMWRAIGIQRFLAFLVRQNRAVREERDWVIYGYEFAVDGIRRLIRGIGAHLKETGRLNMASDIRFLTLEEAVSLFQLPADHADTTSYRAAVEVRRRARYRSVTLWQAPPKRQREGRGRAILSGAAASPGRVSGRACLVLSDRDFARIRPGDILVCQATAPAWTPLFAQASAVVTDVGGILSHAAIVAREYAIPAVLGTGHATQTLREGSIYIVDGSKGVVEIPKS